MRLEAPYYAPLTLTVLPNPEWGNIESLAVDINHRIAMDGTNYTYVKSGSDKRLTLEWNSMTRYKQIELYYFLLNYSNEYIRLTDWSDNVWRVRLLTAPAEMTIDRRGDPVYEISTVRLEFRGAKVS